MSESQIVACPSCDKKNRVPAGQEADQGKCGACQSPLFTNQPLKLTQANFERHTSVDLPVLVDFWADWCGPCKMMAPVLDEAAKKLEPRLRIAKVNTEQEQGLAMRYGIRSIPTMALFKNGQEVDRISGAMPLAQLEQWLSRHI